MPRRTKNGWQTVNHKTTKGKELTEVYRLKRLGDGSEWLAFKVEEQEKFLSELLAQIEGMKEILNRPTFGVVLLQTA